MAGSRDEEAEAAVTAAATAVLGGAPQRLERLPGGMNNALYRFDLDGPVLVAKVYFTHTDDPRDRLGTEFQMSSFLWERSTRCIPGPVGMSRAHSTAFYNYIEGSPLSEGSVTEVDLDQYAQFVLHMWELSRHPDAGRLPKAAEAAFTMLDRLGTVSNRLQWLQDAMDPGAVTARAFLVTEAVPLLQRLREWGEGLTAATGTTMDEPVPEAERTLSPGDVGLHNCMRAPAGLVFHDFEYGGWDDVAQVIVQTCLAPAIQVPEPLHPRLLRRLVGSTGGGELLTLRVRLNYPVLALKWALIMLNEFVEVGRARRSFAGGVLDEGEGSRITKARRMLEIAERAIDPRSPLSGLTTEGG